MVIMVSDLVPACDTNLQGDVLRAAILHALSTSGIVEVSFAGLTAATSSFVNSAFVDLLDTLSLDGIKSRIRIRHSSGQINDMIRTRLMQEARRAVAA